MVDDGTGTKEIYRIINNELSAVPVYDHGKFFAGDCYVINYSYKAGGTDQNIIYYWLVNYFSFLKAFSTHILKIKK